MLRKFRIKRGEPKDSEARVKLQKELFAFNKVGFPFFAPPEFVGLPLGFRLYLGQRTIVQHVLNAGYDSYIPTCLPERGQSTYLLKSTSTSV